MRTLPYPRGVTVTGTDEELDCLGGRHADLHHAADDIPDEHVRRHVPADAREADPVRA